MKIIETDVLVVGSGIAGVMSALKAARNGCKVLLTSKVSMKSGNSIFAGGGWLIPSEDFPPDAYFRWVMEGGKQVNNAKLVRVLAQRGEVMIRALKEMGISLEKKGEKYWYVKMGNSSKYPGSTLMDELLTQVKKKPIETQPWVCIIDLLLEDGRISGALGISRTQGPLIINAKSIILATGGAGGIYRRSSNHRRIIGNGYWLALKAGLSLMDMEFIQFYPIGLAEPFLPSTIIQPPIPREARILNTNGENLLEKYSLKFDLNESVMQYRDELTVILSKELQDGAVYMDCTEVPAKKWKKWFLNRLATINPEFRNRPFLIAPAVHFLMGGIEIDQYAQTAIPGLFAAGEVTAGIHGANRQGGNALTECMVFGNIAGRSASGYARKLSRRKIKDHTIRTEFHWDTHNTGGKKLFSELQDLTWTHAGPIRNACSLKKGLQWNSTLKKRTEELASKEKSILLNELKGSLMVSEAILRASLERKESRGAFYRDDFSNKDDANWLKNIFLKVDSEKNHFIVSHHPTTGQH